MKTAELRKKTTEELKMLLGDTRKEQHDLDFQMASRQLKNVRRIREAKKTVARLLTLLKNPAAAPTTTASQII